MVRLRLISPIRHNYGQLNQTEQQQTMGLSQMDYQYLKENAKKKTKRIIEQANFEFNRLCETTIYK